MLINMEFLDHIPNVAQMNTRLSRLEMYRRFGILTEWVALKAVESTNRYLAEFPR